MDDEMSWGRIAVIGSIAAQEHFHLWWQLAFCAILKSMAVNVDRNKRREENKKGVKER